MDLVPWYICWSYDCDVPTLILGHHLNHLMCCAVLVWIILQLDDMHEQELLAVASVRRAFHVFSTCGTPRLLNQLCQPYTAVVRNSKTEKLTGFPADVRCYHELQHGRFHYETSLQLRKKIVIATTLTRGEITCKVGTYLRFEA